ncbi:hypothetical protein AMIS_7730 [Actinoplanes missouriensis 431]|uniref:Uncharacterized protein n=1 Tax=Actinoplanes missouriensis (strain ATCC 14538 / DSM 43046 / CBS 188.64 / JCM 3121 / NBRC 102363 / NCIMB 12654 / NRRL B-3342 / UNCC 431) TaxID=512565 RepID=I0GZ06_ACTM4|nr:hypothetical protein [Actinoplanes missouriensis]BAL85993.1 hypothetical protein AMIS_7730 [Actinoplanes missouriensis 431]
MSDFAAAIDRLLNQVRHWEERRWSQPATTTGQTRAQLIHGLAQQLADLGAEAEKSPRHELPLLHPMVLPDQLRVLADDILIAGPPPELLTRATTAVTEAHKTL